MNCKRFNLIMSHPRSGQNWSRYIIEYVTQYQTMSLDIAQKSYMCNKLPSLDIVYPKRNPLHMTLDNIDDKIFNESPVFIFTHLQNIHEYDSLGLTIGNNGLVIFIIRNPEGTVSSRILRDIHNTDNEYKPGFMNEYFGILKMFCQIPENACKKILLHYEDLLDKNSIEQALSPHIDTLMMDREKLDDFINNFSNHVKISKESYGETLTKLDRLQFSNRERLKLNRHFYEMFKASSIEEKSILSRYVKEVENDIS